MIKLIDIFNEIKVNNPIITPDIIFKYIADNNLYKSEYYDELTSKYFDPQISTLMLALLNLPQDKLNQFYRELQKIK